MISDDGRALLTDFGFSHIAEASFSVAAEQRPGGTLNWMAPEYVNGFEVTMTTAGDVWAFGMTALVSSLTNGYPIGAIYLECYRNYSRGSVLSIVSSTTQR